MRPAEYSSRCWLRSGRCRPRNGIPWSLRILKTVEPKLPSLQVCAAKTFAKTFLRTGKREAAVSLTLAGYPIALVEIILTQVDNDSNEVAHKIDLTHKFWFSLHFWDEIDTFFMTRGYCNFPDPSDPPGINYQSRIWQRNPLREPMVFTNISYTKIFLL
jgi:hypothetical protein